MAAIKSFLVVLAIALFLPATSLAANQSLSPATYESLNRIQTLLQEEKWTEAEEGLKRLSQKLRPSFGLALTYQLYGQLYLAQDNSAKAVEQFEKALQLDKLAPAQESALATNVAQLYLAQEKSEQAISNLKPRITKIEKQEVEANTKLKKGAKAKVFLQPMAYATLATAYHTREQYDQVIPWILKALEREKEPKENWLQILTVAYYQEKQYLNAAKGFGKLIVINPEKEDYWVQQASMYQLLEQSHNSLRSMETAYAGGFLSKENNLMLLVQLLIGQGVPERAGRLLSKHLKNGDIKLSESNWRLLASAWQQGRERDNAIGALREAAVYMDTGDLLLRAAQMSIQNNDYPQVLVDIRAALDKGLTDKQKGNALILAGNSAFELRDYAAAKRFFQRALKEPKSASSAKSWLDYISSVEEYLTDEPAYELISKSN